MVYDHLAGTGVPAFSFRFFHIYENFSRKLLDKWEDLLYNEILNYNGHINDKAVKYACVFKNLRSDLSQW